MAARGSFGSTDLRHLPPRIGPGLRTNIHSPGPMTRSNESEVIAVCEPHRRPRARAACDDSGFSLIEVVVAMVLLGILSAAVLAVIIQSQSMTVTNRSRVAASNLAAREIDMVREEFTRSTAGPTAIAAAGTQVNPHPLDAGTVGDPLVVDGTPYTVVRAVAWNITGAGVSACDGGSLVPYPTLGVTVTVTWPHMGSVKPVVSEASLAPTKGSAVPGTASFIAVHVVDAAGHPNAGRTVRVVGGSESRSARTDTSGCAVIQVNPAGGPGTTYTAQVTDAGFVDLSGVTGPTKTVGQLPQGRLNNSVSFAYDRAGQVVVRLVDASGILVDDASVAGTTVTLVASEFSGSTGMTPLAITGATTTVPGLWPTSYGAYAGTTAPTCGFASIALAPGGTLQLDVPVEEAACPPAP